MDNRDASNPDRIEFNGQEVEIKDEVVTVFNKSRSSTSAESSAHGIVTDTNIFHQMVREAYRAAQLRKLRREYEEQNRQRNALRRRKKQQRQNRRRSR